MVAIGYLEAFPGSKIEYSVVKRLDKIETIKDEILKVVEQPSKVDKLSLSLAFSPATIKRKFTNNFMPITQNETDVANCCDEIKYFMLNIGFPMLEKFNSLQELNSEINGSLFWNSDWQMPFNLGGGFDIIRIIIAWLAGNLNFDDIVDRTYEVMSQNSDGTYYYYDRNDLKLRIPYTVYYLKNFVEV